MPKGKTTARPVTYLHFEAVGNRIGRSPNTVKNRYFDGRMPTPDAYLQGAGGVLRPGWLPRTIDTWWAARREPAEVGS